MRGFVTLLLLVVLLLSSTSSVSQAHPHQEFLETFGPHLKCPYASKWLLKGPRRAAQELGIAVVDDDPPSRHHHHYRYLQTTTYTTSGTCSFLNSFTSSLECVTFRGDNWTPETMQLACNELTGTLTTSTTSECPVPSDLAGYCIVSQSGLEAASALSEDCDGSQNLCENILQGTFEPASACGGGADSLPATSAPGNTTETDGESAGNATNCLIAPGPIGGAHQLATSTGYSNTCPDTPAEGSPYQWPLAWSATTDSKSMAFGSDEIVYHSQGVVYYRLDKNWKRQDWLYQRGVQRAIGQSLCAPENIVNETNSTGATLACRRDSDVRSTMIHRNNQMYFISWKNGSVVDDSPENIANCTWIDLAVIGNVRPDWFMDDRGDTTDVQYLGDQHVYHNGVPRLVKQWRKKDFADQYFVMSMLANPANDTIHWPLILNVPGEGFGDDFLQSYSNHIVLTDADDVLFNLMEAFEAAGGSCPEMDVGGDIGPPTSEVEPIPSNLEIDPNSWRSIVYTYSPVWSSPNNESSGSDGDSGSSIVIPSEGYAVTEADQATIHSCFDNTSGNVQMIVSFDNIQDTGDGLPWIALGYRQDEECLMLPRDGGDTNIILLSVTDLTGPTASYGQISSATRALDEEGVTDIYSSLTPLETVDGYSGVKVFAPGSVSASSTEFQQSSSSSVQLVFQQQVDTAPEAMYLMYAIGSSPILGYHASRLCFEVTEFPACGEGYANIGTDSNNTDGSDGSVTGGFPDFGNVPSSAEGEESSSVSVSGLVLTCLMSIAVTSILA